MQLTVNIAEDTVTDTEDLVGNTPFFKKCLSFFGLKGLACSVYLARTESERMSREKQIAEDEASVLKRCAASLFGKDYDDAGCTVERIVFRPHYFGIDASHYVNGLGISYSYDIGRLKISSGGCGKSGINNGTEMLVCDLLCFIAAAALSFV